MNAITLVEAINQAIAYEMTQDKNVIIFGEDIAVNGGVFRTTVGLLEKFGPERVLDTPLAESMIAGMAIGMAAQGLKPIAEFQFSGFIYSAVDQILSHAARLRNRTRGRLSCPLVYRAPYGGGIHAPEHHSESMEALFAHIPGIRVVIPSSPAKAYGLLLASIRNPDPVLFLEPKRIYRLIKQEIVDHGEALPLDKCFIDKEGSDITLISWGAMIKETIETAEKLESEGISAEIIDLATISPIDMGTILTSVEKTGRCVIISEAPRTCGVAAEIAAQLAEYAFDILKAPVQRVTGYDTVMPYAQLEKNYMPNVARILKSVKIAMEY
ncbi:MAG: alpha-ketoacid dehydrogenase subunit beta [Gammaproteobacteria bacterium CG_4_10_14_0_8_um_filter_38_16]|nr:MAG: alpha-ketoacid dehydrogenase subunit beta [Gammaproteobacteria bacterium CG_4_10_14_0_8_um_filter_38_16]PJA03542.1 MAG: alpha-ketoacid dehydrogenase subunit beta [Gammaproteobacteria bacterium CG_4_10_14_0_2_um_filter_38_22]PJB11164.1 MAG: alpha-ketoacid dehydrogenase subunit beta [Gammaproteobacteria bacterium CG_4_9_14_3_um_filter_38_9]